MKYGINSIGPQFFDGTPDLAVAGPNVSLAISEKLRNCPRSHVHSLIAAYRLETILGWRPCYLAPLERPLTLPMMLEFPQLHFLEPQAPKLPGMPPLPTRLTAKYMPILRSI
jgi:hypothetical protein